jgi:hypothetical protein
VRVLAVHEAWGVLCATRGQLAPDGDLLDVASAGATPELEHLERAYGPEVERAFRTVILALPARDRTLLRRHFLDGVCINELGRLYRVHRATIRRWLERARDRVLAATRAHLRGTSMCRARSSTASCGWCRARSISICDRCSRAAAPRAPTALTAEVIEVTGFPISR